MCMYYVYNKMKRNKLLQNYVQRQQTVNMIFSVETIFSDIFCRFFHECYHTITHALYSRMVWLYSVHRRALYKHFEVLKVNFSEIPFLCADDAEIPEWKIFLHSHICVSSSPSSLPNKWKIWALYFISLYFIEINNMPFGVVSFVRLSTVFAPLFYSLLFHVCSKCDYYGIVFHLEIVIWIRKNFLFAAFVHLYHSCAFGLHILQRFTLPSFLCSLLFSLAPLAIYYNFDDICL